MRFTIDQHLLIRASAALAESGPLYWLVGGAGSGKTTICQVLAVRLGVPVCDMDAHIYGSYHGRFTLERHPVNTAWSTAPNGLGWLLDMSWDEFNGFNQAALPEYLDMLAEDLAAMEPHGGLLVDGGICNPALLAPAIPARQIVCLAAPNQSGAQTWEEPGVRRSMKEAIHQLDDPEARWSKFLEFDRRIRQTILDECQESGISICWWERGTSVEELAQRVASQWALR
jgi:hypothetical protein